MQASALQEGLPGAQLAEPVCCLFDPVLLHTVATCRGGAHRGLAARLGWSTLDQARGGCWCIQLHLS